MTVFAQRMNNIHKSFIREILKVTENPEIISFAGGLPNPKFFPVAQIAEAAQRVLQDDGAAALQYSTSEGYPPLREFIARRYHQRFGLEISPDEILITNGSQQGLDLIGKIFLDEGDAVGLERPGYLGAIQAFAMYQPQFCPVSLRDNGPDLGELAHTLAEHPLKLFYAGPNFQNPSGLTYAGPVRRELARMLAQYPVTFIEDDPYGELRFTGQEAPSLRSHLPDQTILLGSFSKVVSPGLRLGWICARPAIMERLIIAKQAADLHSNFLAQRIVARYLLDNDLDRHLATIKSAYKQQRDLMVSMLEECFPPEVSFTRPEGGMFIWLTLPEGSSAMELFHLATRRNVAFVPGQAFYIDGGGQNTLRLNFSNSDEARIETGIQRLAEATKSLLAGRGTGSAGAR